MSPSLADAPPLIPTQQARMPRAALILLLLAGGLTLLWPGDAPWVFDEPLLIAKAIGANAAHVLAPAGLAGTHGVQYGPLPIWIYQALLLVTRDPVVLVAIRATVVTAVVVASLISVARTAGLSPWFPCVVLLSPYLWVWDRQLWDNSFCVPLAGASFAAYLAYLRTGSAAAWRTAMACAAVMPLIHLMSLAYLAALAVHVIWLRPASLVRFRWTLLVLLAVVFVPAYPYWKLLYATVGTGPGTEGLSRAAGFVFPLTGGRLFTVEVLKGWLGEGWPMRAGLPAAVVLKTAGLISCIGYFLPLAGIALAARRAWAMMRRRTTPTPLGHAALLALLIVACQSLLDGAARVYEWPHYHNATWIAYAVLAWIAIDALPRRGPWRAVLPAYGASLAIPLVWVMLYLHRTGGTAEPPYGPTVGNQRDVADEVLRYPPRTPSVSVVVHVPDVLSVSLRGMELLRRPLAKVDRGAAGLAILFRYRTWDDGHLEVRELRTPPATRPAPRGLPQP